MERKPQPADSRLRIAEWLDAVQDRVADTLLKYEPRLLSLHIELLPQTQPGHLVYALDATLEGNRIATFGTTLSPEGRAVVRHLKRHDVRARA